MTATALYRGPVVSPLTAQSAGDPGSQVAYTLAVTNSGQTAEAFSISVEQAAWQTAAPPSIGPLQPGEAATLQVTVTVPLTAPASASDQALIRFTSPTPGVASGSALLETSANTVFGLEVTASPDAQTVRGDAVPVTYTLWLTNAGNAADSFDIAITTTWTATFTTPVGPLAAGESLSITVVIFVPAGVANNASDDAILILRSQGNPLRFQQVTLTTTAIWHQLFLPIALRNP